MEFLEFAAQPDDDLDLLTGAVLIARDAYPDLDVGGPSLRLDALADSLGPLGGCDVRSQAAQLASHLYVTHGFRGNATDYYDPRNSFINEVLERRLGIPISLALVYMEVARRAGVQASGINFPGHFLVRIDGLPGEPACIVDPFTKGRVLTHRALERLLSRSDRKAVLEESLLEPAGARDILMRFLNNLRGIYTKESNLGRLVVVLSRLIELAPHNSVLFRDRGLAAAKLGAARAAIADFEQFLDMAPHADEAPEVRKLIEKLVTQRAPLN